MKREPGQAYPPLALPGAEREEDLQQFQQWLETAIPMAGRLGMQGLHWQDDKLLCDVHLASNLNDKGTAFGGSLTAQATLLGWCWATLWLRARGRHQNVVVAEAGQRFLAPVMADYRLSCCAEDTMQPAHLEARLNEHGRGHIRLVQQLHVEDTLCFEAVGDYAILPAVKRP